MILAALYEMRAAKTKQDTIDYIEAHDWFDLQPNDLKPYDAQPNPRWHNMIALARLAALKRELLLHHDATDHWEISTKGVDAVEELRSQFSDRLLDVRLCFLWSRTFKRWMSPTYEPSEMDRARPRAKVPAI
ncbi:MAG: hypothetical protein ABSE48_19305 [Verrucomicrobiota bacterium]|jgi:hypothetical protein